MLPWHLCHACERCVKRFRFHTFGCEPAHALPSALANQNVSVTNTFTLFAFPGIQRKQVGNFRNQKRGKELWTRRPNKNAVWECEQVLWLRRQEFDVCQSLTGTCLWSCLWESESYASQPDQLITITWDPSCRLSHSFHSKTVWQRHVLAMIFYRSILKALPVQINEHFC